MKEEIKTEKTVKKLKYTGKVERLFVLKGVRYDYKSPSFKTNDKAVFDNLIKRGLISKTK